MALPSGSVDLGGRTCQVEFISANPDGTTAHGSARNAVLGDAIGNVLAAAGWNVQREYYVNDAGTQLRTFAETCIAATSRCMGLRPRWKKNITRAST